MFDLGRDLLIVILLQHMLFDLDLDRDRDLLIVLLLQHMMIDLGTGNNNKINWPMEDGQELIDIIETVYRGARKGQLTTP